MPVVGSNKELIDLLRQTPDILRALVGNFDDDRAHERDDGGWSAVEVIGHLIDTERRSIERIDHLQRERNPVLVGYDQAEMVERLAYQERNLASVMAEFLELRERRVSVLDALDDAGWARSAGLAGVGDVTLREITLHMCWHDANHLAQIARMTGPERRRLR